MTTYSDNDLTKLKTAYASGRSSVTLSSGDQISYRSLAEMERAIRRIEAELSPKPRRRLGYRMSVGRGI